MRNRTLPAARRKGRPRVALYLRVSTAQQIEGYGLEVQEKQCRALLDRGFGAGGYVLEEDDIYIDGAVSGKRASRPRLDEMNRLRGEGQYDVICFGKLDRIGRTMKDIHRWMYDTTDLGVRVLTGDGRIDSDDDMFGIIMSLLAFMAELEHTLILERTMSGREQKLAAGGWPSGVAPYGLALSGKGKEAVVVHQEDEVHVINRAVGYKIDDGQNREEVARSLNARGDLRRSGRSWDGLAVDRLLTSSHLLEGVVHYRKTSGSSKTKLAEDGTPLYGPTVAIPVPRILDPERAKALAKVMEEESREHRASEQYPLSKRIEGSCGRVYVGAYRTGNDERMYRCQGAVTELGTPTCGDSMLAADAVEAAVWGKLSRHLEDPESLRELAKEYVASLPGDHDKYTERVESQRKQVTEAQAALGRAITNCAKLKLDEDATREATDELQMELSALRGALAESEAWLMEYGAKQARADDMIAMIERSKGKMQTLDLGRQAAVFEMFNITVVPRDHQFQRRTGRKCTLTAWHLENAVAVPDDPDDSGWGEMQDILLDISPDLLAGRYDSRQALKSILYRLRTGATWEDVDGLFGVSKASAKRALGAWFGSGAWEAMMGALLAHGGSTPVYQPPEIPGLSIRGKFPVDLLNDSHPEGTVFSDADSSTFGSGSTNVSKFWRSSADDVP
ncbi:recombinase family protein [Streptomyces sp. NPDC059994]|uniref:recombinase family protein n=1 Tax=Streptomyces sp. NPDC059994 TaxID=3347029 RepID=UPI0036C0410D